MAKTSIYAGATQVRTNNRQADAAKAVAAAKRAVAKAAEAQQKAAEAQKKADKHAALVLSFAIDLTDLDYETVVVMLDAMKARANAWEILTPTEAAARDAKRVAKKLEPKGIYEGGLAQMKHKAGWSDAEIRVQFKKRLGLVAMLQNELAAVDKAVEA